MSDFIRLDDGRRKKGSTFKSYPYVMVRVSVPRNRRRETWARQNLMLAITCST